MRLWGTIVLLMPLGLWAQQSETDSLPLLKQVISVEAARSDLQALGQWVLDTHPAALTEDSFLIIGAVRRAERALVHPQSNWMFARTVAEVLGTLGDSHTGLNWRELTREMEATWGRFPEHVQLDGGQIQSAHTGQFIDSVNHWSARAVLENARKMCSSEAFARPAHYRRSARLWPWVAAVPGPGVAEGSVVAWNREGTAIPMSPPRPVTAARKPTKDPGLHGTFEGGIATLTVPSFSQGTASRFTRQARRFFRKVRRKHAEGVVIDLRGNAGGLASRMETLAAHWMRGPDALVTRLEFRNTAAARSAFAPDFERARPGQRKRWARRDRWAAWRLAVEGVEEGALWTGALRDLPPHRKAYSGPVAVLVDGSTASTAAHLAMWTDAAPGRVAVGEPALTGPHGTGAHAASWSLPASGLPVVCASMRIWVTEGTDWSTGQWTPSVISPHLAAPEAAADWIRSQ